MCTYHTGRAIEDIGRCADIEELKLEILPLLQGQRTMWAAKVEEIMEKNNLSCKQMAKLCEVSEPAVRKWKKGSLPQSRNMYIRIGFAAGYNLEEMNAFLTRYGRCPKLYVKSLEDSVCIFVLQSEILEHTYESYMNLLKIVKEEMDAEPEVKHEAYSTVNLSERFTHVRSLDEMITFAKMNVPSYRQAYNRLYDYIIFYLMVNIDSDHFVDGDGRGASIYAMKKESQWSSSLYHCVSEIRQRKWFPLRHKIISLGLHLNMDAESINLMLQYAQMEPLYAKNPIEAAIIWAINEAKLNSENDELIQDGSRFLCDYVKDILEQLGLTEESDYLVNDL